MDEIKQRIVELVPEIMELKFGCLVQDPDFPRPAIVVRVFPSNPDGSYSFKTQYWKEGSVGNIGLDGDAKNWKILGRPIQLHDVLRAVDKSRKRDGWEYFVTSSGTFHKINIMHADYTPTALFRFDLSLDFDSQTPEVRAFIGTLLGIPTKGGRV